MKTFFLSVLMLFAVAAPAISQDVARIDRLEKLATFLESKVDSRHFDINSWGSTGNADDSEYVGCAGGHATRIFVTDGLHLHIDQGRRTPVVVYERFREIEAMQKFMGIDASEATFLFTKAGEAGRDPTVAARNLRAVAAKYKIQRSLAFIAFR